MSYIHFQDELPSFRSRETGYPTSTIKSEAKKLIDIEQSKQTDVKSLIMTIDDNAAQHDVIASMLKDEYDHLACTEVHSFIETYQQHISKVKTIILDIRLGEDNNGNQILGYDIFRQLKEINPSIPIIFRTGFQDEYDNELEVYKTYRPHGYIVKNCPDERNIVLNTVNSAIASYETIKDNEKAQNMKMLFRGIRGWIHDFRNLFMSVKSREFMIATKPDKFSKTDIVVLLKENLKCIDMLQDLQSTMTDYATGETVKTQLTPIELKKECKEFLHLIRVIYPKLIFKTHFNFTDRKLTNKTVLFSQILLNMIKNAYTAGAKMVDIETYKYSQYLKKYPGKIMFKNTHQNNLILVFRDNGGGVPPEIEDKFFTIDFTFNVPDGQGLGTWLINEGIENRLKGEFYYINTIGEGLEYHICLPLLNEEAPPSLFI